ncbi:heparinase [Algoriphagus sp. NBT04N3]|uniref:alginate lyase family protein n=1 Tax=Algoriphagus sp. NBT04N3 TaxID=2705473 RepID=UPI0021068B69|nr:alginate lyase family protein [Algoriphagus sp. NBT04N3]QYH37973.1 heparinase [Algoriphagus sp. NBT04N3]
MFQKIQLAFQFIQNMGARYIKYRVFHELEKRTGILKKRHPQSKELISFVSWDNWKKESPAFLFESRSSFNQQLAHDPELADRISKMKEGIFRFFFHQEYNLGPNYDWITHPVSKKKFSNQLHWSEIPDLDPELGDIKYVWEKSRFTYLLEVIRHDQISGEDHSLWVKNEICSWISQNPINSGPNWRCSQEISLRIFNWCFALNFYKYSPQFDEEFWVKIQTVIYWSLHHVYNHINFSRIAVRNNHAITETLFLAVSNWLFPFIPETKKWALEGRKWFEEEIEYQVYQDGTFLQFSMNYHRVVVQLLTLGIRLSEIHGKPFSKIVFERAYDSLKFLLLSQDEETGFLPNYGANDGALFFPLTNQNFRDYRPQLNALHLLLTGKPFYKNGHRDDWFWWEGGYKGPTFQFPPVQRQDGSYSFPIGGFFIIRDGDTLTFIRCGSHKDRPQQADNLHLDIWVKGENILMDSGTYRYNCPPDLKENFEGTIGHNTVTIDKKSQMLKGSRFIWYYWTQCLGHSLKEKENSWDFEGKISAFRFLFRNCTHLRKVVKIKGEYKWEIIDTIQNVPAQINAFQVWNFEDFSKLNIKTSPDFQLSDNLSDLHQGFSSEYYGEYHSIHRLYLPIHSNFIQTTIVYSPE